MRKFTHYFVQVMQEEKLSASPIWYLFPVAFMALTGTALVDYILGVDIVQRLARWLALHGQSSEIRIAAMQGKEMPLALVSRALSFLMLPIATLGVWYWMWPIRNKFAAAQSMAQSPWYLEIAELAIYVVIFWSAYFSPVNSRCAFCPVANSVFQVILEAIFLFVLSMFPCLIVLSIYTRLTKGGRK